MKRLLRGAIGVFLLAGSIVSAQAPAQGQGRQGGGGRATWTNLQVLERDSTPQQLMATMQTISTQIGVTCDYCHVTAQDAPAVGRGRAAAPPPIIDYASDAKQQKRTARVMIRMTRDIRSKLGAELGKPPAEVVFVQCVTCHRGVPIPRQLVDIVADTAMAKSAAAAVDQYRELRQQFYGSAAYDFSDYTLFTAAQRANTAMRPDDALAYLQANVEFYPNSARSYQQMSVAYQLKMDRANAIAMLEKAASSDPMNSEFRNQLNNLRNPPAPQQ